MTRFVWALDAHTIAHVHQTEQQHFVWHNIYRNINSFLPIFPHFSGGLKKKRGISVDLAVPILLLLFEY